MKFVIDIDGTLMYSIIKDERYVITGINKTLISVVNKLYAMGHVIVIWTGRHWNHLKETKMQLDKYEIKYTTLLMGKPDADYYIDDKAISPEEFLK